MDIMDFGKAFDTINHDLLLPVFFYYGFGKQSLVIISQYSSNCEQRVKVCLNKMCLVLDSVLLTWTI